MSKKIVAFLQLYNELDKGNLIRCLDNCSQWSDEILIYDDASTDGSMDVYLKYTEIENIIVGTSNEFNRELYHKEQLLGMARSKQPDFIGWIDGDDIFDRTLTENMQAFLEDIPKSVDGVQCHNVNLWRDDRFYRVDNLFDGLDKINIWRNSTQLRYEPSGGLHQPQNPQGMQSIVNLGNKLLHYGFASERSIARKYLDYKSHGQGGWALDRLIDEQSSFYLLETPTEWYPQKNLPVCAGPKPTPITFNEYRQFNSWSEYLNAK